MNRLIWTAAAIVALGLAALGFANRKAVQISSKQAVTTQGNKPPSSAAIKPVASPGAASTGASLVKPIGYGLTFAVVNDPNLATDTVYLSCHGEPKLVDRPHKDSCNPYKGDTSCRAVLPVACAKTTGAAAPGNAEPGLYQGWMRGSLGATQPVMGAILESEAQASALCEKELGSGWRMAEFVDGPNGWGLQGERGLGLNGNNRYWVHAKGQPGNCWNSAP